jgi:diguanylate cyclase (GGDEF)-like protein
MLALTQCWFTRTHVPAYPGQRNKEGIYRSECRHCDRPIISTDRKTWQLAEGFNLMTVYQGIEKPFLFLIDTRNDFVVARFPIDHLECENEVEEFIVKIKADNNVDDPDSALALRDSRKRKFPRRKVEKDTADIAAAPRGIAPPADAADAISKAAASGDGSALLAANASRAARDEDKLTGLPGRGAFEAVFEAEFRRALAQREPLAIAFIDIDKLDRLNRAHGLDTGDRLIRAVAAELGRIPQCHRHLSRNRGLEFLLLFRNADVIRAIELLEPVRKAIAALPAFAVEGEGPTISCGLAEVPLEGDPRSALRAADVALHRAKASGGGELVTGTAEG